MDWHCPFPKLPVWQPRQRRAGRAGLTEVRGVSALVSASDHARAGGPFANGSEWGGATVEARTSSNGAIGTMAPSSSIEVSATCAAGGAAGVALQHAPTHVQRVPEWWLGAPSCAGYPA